MTDKQLHEMKLSEITDGFPSSIYANYVSRPKLKQWAAAIVNEISKKMRDATLLPTPDITTTEGKKELRHRNEIYFARFAQKEIFIDRFEIPEEMLK